MFAEWVATGAAFGIKAFFAICVFLLCCLAILGLLAILTSFFRTEDENDLGGR